MPKLQVTTPCPAFGSYTDSSGQRQHYREVSRVLCIVQHYEDCTTCPNADFGLEAIRADCRVTCPVNQRALDEYPADTAIEESDLRRAREKGVAGADVDLNTCLFDMPYLACPGCTTRKRWKTR